MSNIRIRKPTSATPYPHNSVRILRGEAERILRTVKHHFANRHHPTDGAQYRKAARNWAQGFKEFDARSGYSTALAQTLGKLETPTTWNGKPL